MDRWLQGLRAHRVLLIVLAALLALYALAGFVVAPRVLRAQATKFVTQQLHRQLHIAEIRFNPFTFTLDVRQLALSEADGTPLVGFGALRVNAELSSLIHRAIVLKEVTLEAPRVRAVLAANGDLNLDGLVPPTSANAAAAPAAPAGPIAIRVGQFTVRGGRVEFEDFALQRPVSATLTPIDFTLRDFQTQAGHQNAYHFDARTLANEALSWDGQFTLQPLGSSGAIKVSALRASTIAAWLQDALPFALPSGTLDLSGNYQLSYGTTLGLTLQVPSLALTSFSIAPRSDPAQTWLQLPSVRLSDIAVALSGRSVHVASIAVDHARVQLQRHADGSLNLTRLFTPAAAPAAAAPAGGGTATSAAPQPWKITLADLALKDASIEVSDESTQPAAQFQLQPVNARIRDYSSDPAHPLDVLLDVGIGKGSLHAEGQAVIDPLGADLKLEARALELPALQPYLTQQSDLQLDAGRFTGSLQLQYASQPARKQPGMRLRGDLQVDDLATRDALHHQNLVAWKQLQIAGIDFQQRPDRWSVQRVTLREPQARVRIEANGVINIAEVISPTRLHPQPARPTAQTAAARPAGPVTPARLGLVTLLDGTVSFTDVSLEPPFSTNIYGLAGTVKGLSSVADSRAVIQLAGSVDKYAPVTIGGEVNLLAASTYTDLTMKFANMDLTTFNPYSGKFAGYNITRGKLTTELHYVIKQRALAAEHHVVLDQLEFGAATDSKDAVPLPVKLAVALLKDRNGVIDLNLPVAGTLDDPSFKLGPIIWKAVRNLLTKIVTAPFALLGSLFGGGPELSYIDFSPGQSTLAPEQAGKLTTLAHALGERPQLKLDIPLAAVSALDDAALARAQLEAALPQLPSGKGKAAVPAVQDADGQRQQRLAQLTMLYATQTGTAPVWSAELTPQDPKAALSDDLVTGRIAWLEAALLPRYAPTAADRDALGRARAEAVRAALLDGSMIDPQRVFLSAGAAQPKEPDGAVRMELKLE